jgi:hypothetical protein
MTAGRVSWLYWPWSMRVPGSITLSYLSDLTLSAETRWVQSYCFWKIGESLVCVYIFHNRKMNFGKSHYKCIGKPHWLVFTKFTEASEFFGMLSIKAKTICFFVLFCNALYYSPNLYFVMLSFTAQMICF